MANQPKPPRRAAPPFVVKIESTAGRGTGAVVNADGWLLAAHHLVHGAQRIVAQLPLLGAVAYDVVETLAADDLALLRPSAPPAMPVPFGAVADDWRDVASPGDAIEVWSFDGGAAAQHVPGAIRNLDAAHRRIGLEGSERPPFGGAVLDERGRLLGIVCRADSRLAAPATLIALEPRDPGPGDAAIETIRRRARAFRLADPRFGAYLAHSAEHADRSARILEQWLLDEEHHQLFAHSPWTRYFLFAAVALCDLHVVYVKQPFGSAEAAQGLAAIIRERWLDLGVNRQAQATLLAEICGAAVGTVPLEELRARAFEQTGERISVSMLVMLLRMLWHLDLTNQRLLWLLTSLGITNVPPGRGAYELEGVAPTARESTAIAADVTCRSAELHRQLKAHESLVQKILSSAAAISGRLRFSSFSYDITSVGYEPVDVRFRVEASVALQILIGTAVYTNEAAFLRELIQNSVDACELRRSLEPNHEPRVMVRRDVAAGTVTVADNGIGMNLLWAEKYLTRVGVSFYRSEEFRDLTRTTIGFSPISRFGIGILSCFVAGRKVRIRSRRPGSDGIELEIADPNGYFAVRAAPGAPAGTEVTVELKDPNLDCLPYLSSHVLAPSVPVDYRFAGGSVIPLGGVPVKFADFYRAAPFDAPAAFAEERLPLESEAYVSFELDMRTGLPKVDLRTRSSVTVMQDGFFVTGDEHLLPAWAENGMRLRANLREYERLDLAISRSAFVQGRGYRVFRELVETSAIALLRRVFAKCRELVPDEVERMRYRDAVEPILRAIAAQSRLTRKAVALLKDYFCFYVYEPSGSRLLFHGEVRMMEAWRLEVAREDAIVLRVVDPELLSMIKVR